MSRSMSSSRPGLSFKPSAPTLKPSASTLKPSAPIQNFPPGALVPGQRPDRALNNAQFAAAQDARSSGTAQGLTGRALEIFVAQAAMNAK